MGKKSQFTAEREERLTAFLSRNVAGLSAAKANILIKSGEVRVNGLRTKVNATVCAGDEVSVFVPDELNVSAPKITVLYDDQNIAVFDKPKRIAYDGLPALYGQPLLSVHRLDTNTTGVIVFAKTERALTELERAFRDRRVNKVYSCVVRPAPKDNSATLTAYTRLLPAKGIALVSDKMQEGYKTMITEYRVVERIGDAAVLEVYPHTGRTHQIRAHLAFIGCPIIGEHKYGKAEKAVSGEPTSQMLAAVRLQFFGLKNGMEYLNNQVFTAEDHFDLSFLKENEKND